MPGPTIPRKAWVLIADGEQAVILRNDGDAVYPNLVVTQRLASEAATPHDPADSAPGGAEEGRSPHWLRAQREHFAKELAGLLYTEVHAGRVEKLVVAAPAATLGALRTAMHGEVRSRVIAEVEKDLVHHPVREIERLLSR